MKHRSEPHGKPRKTGDLVTAKDPGQSQGLSRGSIRASNVQALLWPENDGCPPLSNRAPLAAIPAAVKGSAILLRRAAQAIGSGMPPVRHASFAPHVDADTRLLILGSLPGARSLAEQRYYAHPTNQFWRLLGAVIDRPLAAMDYDGRLAALRAAKAGLWDVIRSAERRSSSDGEIRGVEAHDLAALVETLPELRMIAFNGGKAAAIGRRQLPVLEGVEMVDLPSSSAANTGSYAAKLERWLPLRAALVD
jgi:hypoxanthine-DNA glycosylase